MRVVVTHGNLVANAGQIQQTFGIDPDVTVVNWLPLFHDMGLLSMVLVPVMLAIRSVQLAPIAFVQRPRRWLELISGRPRACATAPDFGYHHCVTRIAPHQRAGLELSGWRVAGNGSEPVRAETLDAFAHAFREQGFDPAAFRPCYGLAEATLLVSGFRAPGPPVAWPWTATR